MHARRNDGQRMSFESVIRKLGHERRTIDILKIDCQGCEYAAMPPLFALIASGKIKVDQVLVELHHTKVGRRLRGDFGRTLQRFFAAADTAKLRITHKERNQWGCDGYRCVEYALVSEAFLREANGAVMCATEAA